MTLEQLVKTAGRPRLEDACRLIFSKMIVGESTEALKTAILRAVDEGIVTSQEVKEEFLP